MLIAAGLALSAVLAQNPTVSLEPEAPPAPPSPVADGSALWLGGAVTRCPENMAFEGRNLRLTEVPATGPEIADLKSDRAPRATRPEVRVPCIAPAGR